VIVRSTSFAISHRLHRGSSSFPFEVRRQYVPLQARYRIFSNIRSASYLNPLNWVKEKLVPVVREKPAKEEVEAGKQQAVEEGTQSVFETAPTPVRPTAVSKRTSTVGIPGIRKPAKARPTSVRVLFCNL
jgi:hypothetical protein